MKVGVGSERGGIRLKSWNNFGRIGLNWIVACIKALFHTSLEIFLLK